MNDIVLSSRQSKAWYYLNDKDTNTILYGGGAGGGKSWLGCIWHIHRRVAYPGTRGLIGRAQLSSIKESTLVTFFAVANLLGYKANQDYKFNGQDFVVNWSNGSRTIFYDLFQYPSDPDFTSLGSTEFTDAFIDEATEVTLKAFDIVKSRLRYKIPETGCNTGKVLLTCNPAPGWIKDTFIRDKAGNPIVLPANRKYIQSLVTDNPDSEFVRMYSAQLSDMSNAYDVQRLLHGDWDATPQIGGEFYHAFDYAKHTDLSAYNPSLPLHLSFDFNVNPYITLIVVQIDGNTANQIDELCLSHPENNTSSLCKRFASKYANHSAGLFICGDPAGRHADTRSEAGHNDYSIIFSELLAFNPIDRVETKAPSVVQRGNFINKLLATDQIKLRFNRNCINSIADLQNVRQAADGTKMKKKHLNPITRISEEKHGHTSDAMDYLICRAFRDMYNEFVSPNRTEGPLLVFFEREY